MHLYLNDLSIILQASYNYLFSLQFYASNITM